MVGIRIGRITGSVLVLAVSSGMLATASAQLAVTPSADSLQYYERNPFRNQSRGKDGLSVSLPADANPFDPLWLNNHAIEMANKGWLGVAEQLLERALRIAPEDPQITANLVRLRNWHQVRSSEFRPVEVYQVPSSNDSLRQAWPAPPQPWSK